MEQKIKRLVNEFPGFNPEWSEEDKLEWFAQFEKLGRKCQELQNKHRKKRGRTFRLFNLAFLFG